MKKLLSFVLSLLLLLFWGHAAFAQISSYYTFSESTGTYSEITGGTVSTISAGDEGVEQNVAIGFNFDYVGNTYSTVTVGINGAIGFTSSVVYWENDLASTEARDFNLVCPLWDDLYARTEDDFEIRYETAGTSPNQTFTVQWKNISWREAGMTVNFQLILFEGSNDIVFNYGVNNSTDTRFASIGMIVGPGGSGNFISVTPGSPATTSTTTANNDIDVTDYPGDGHTYTFTYALPSCPAPADQQEWNITATSVDLRWDEMGSATNWEIEWGLTGFSQGSGTMVTGITSNTYPLTGLTAGTTYDWYVRSDCGGEYSSWTGPSTFTTACIPVFPWSEGFEGMSSVGSGIVPNCMTEWGDWTTADAPLSDNREARTGDNYIFTDHSANDWLVSSSVDLTAGTSYDFSFWYVTDGISGWTTLEAKYGTGQTPVDMTIAIGTPVSDPVNTTYVEYKGSFTPATSGTFYIGIQVEATSNPLYITFDDLSLEETPATTTLPYLESFDADLGDCYVYSVLGNTKNWVWNSSGAASMNGFDSGETEEDWLILPGINFDDYTGELMTFDTWYNSGTGDDETDHYLKLYYSSDYPGTGDPSTVAWTEVPFTHPSGGGGGWTSSGIIDLSALSLTGTVYFAFKYRYTDNYRWWGLNNIAIYEDMVDVTFQVDMQNETVSGDGVFLVGDFSPYYNNWDLGNLPMDDTDADMIYTITLTLPSSTLYQYKFVNGLDWDDAEEPIEVCTYPSTTNRYFTTDIVSGPLDLVCYGLCTDCTPDLYDITFRVNMENEEVLTDVFIAGSFTGWADELMTNTMGTIYEVTLSLPEATYIEYKFKNGGNWEGVSGDCTNGGGNREGIIPAENATIEVVCFGSCIPCTPLPLIISEVALPYDNNSVNFIELYNPGTSTIDFDSDVWYLSRQSNGGDNWVDVQLVGSIDPGTTYLNVWNETEFNTLYAPLTADQESQIMWIAGGDDGLFIFYGGDHETGTQVDAFGVIYEDGTGTAWEYNGTKAVRLSWVNTPNPNWTFWEWHIPEITGSDQTTPGEHKSDVTWTGAIDNNWYTKGDNWSGIYGYIPDASFNVTIPNVAAPPYISNQAACNHLTINSGASLDVHVDIFDIFGNLDVNTGGGFTLYSNETQNASVIVYGTATGDATVHRYFQGYDDGANNGWHNISSPVNNFTVGGSNFDPSGTDDDLYWWEETTSTWKNYKANAFDFSNGQGYLFASQYDDARTFVGTLNTDDIAVTGLTKDEDGFHLLGNPFSSALRWDDGNWNMTNIGGVAQNWDESNNSYAQIAQYNTIPSTNGFFVEVGTAPGSLTIPKYARVHDMVDNYKKAATTDNLVETLDLRLTNDENSFYDLCRVGFKDDATEAWDIKYDAHKLFGGQGTSALWSVIENEDFVYNYLPYVYEPFQLPLHFKAGVNATHHINAIGLNSFYQGTDLFLEDVLMDEIIDLNEQSIYTFTATTDDDEARFILHFNGVTSTGDTPANDDAKIYAYQNTVYVQLNDQTTSTYRVEVINMVGQQVYANEFATNGLNSFKINEKPGVYFVRLRAENKTMVQKVLISK